MWVPEPHALGTGALPTDATTARPVEKGPGRWDERVLPTSRMLQDSSPWPYLAQVCKVERQVTTALGTHPTGRYGVTRLPVTVADAARLLGLGRGHGGIENGVHERRAVTLAEARARVRTGHAQAPAGGRQHYCAGRVCAAGAVECTRSPTSVELPRGACPRASARPDGAPALQPARDLHVS